MADRIDPAAFRAAYNALMPHLPHAQIRAHVAELVAAAVLEKRTAHGVGYMHALVDSADERAHIRLAVHLDSGGTAKALDAAVLTVKFSPDAVQALHALLGLVHYDDIATSWRDMLPQELLAERQSA